MSNSTEDAKNNETEEDNVGGFTVLDEVGEANELYSPKENDESSDETFRISDEMFNDLENITNEVSFTEDDQHIKDLEAGEVSFVDEHQDDNDTIEIRSDKDPNVEENIEDEGSNCHPYLYLIDTFEFPPELMNISTIGEVKKIEQKKFFLINSRGQLEKMLQTLRCATEIGVDLQVNKNEYKEPVCLMEISTKDFNYVIDASKLRYELLLLTEIFINPKIVKVVYSADIILKQFQQKLNLYMINIFDILEARNRVFDKQERISFPGIIKNEYGYDVHNPTIDIRTRPIPDELKLFCQAGVHYILYIYHNYKNKLISKNMDKYRHFLEWCRNACKKIHNDTGKEALTQLENELKNYHICELEVLKKLFLLRNDLAKKYNKRPEIVIGKAAMMRIVKELPDRDTDLVLKSPYIKDEKHTILQFIKEVRARYRVFERHITKRKAIQRQNVPNRQQKRKTNEKYDALPAKQKYIVQNKNNRQRRSRFSDIESNQSSNNFPKNNAQHFNIPSPFFNQNLPATDKFMNNSKQMNMRSSAKGTCNNQFRSNFYMNKSPTNQFHSNSFTQFSEPGQMNFEENHTSDQNGLHKSLVDLKQVRDNLQRKYGNFSNNYFPKISKEMRDIDGKINQLEREVHDIQSKNQRRRSDSYRRRY